MDRSANPRSPLIVLPSPAVQDEQAAIFTLPVPPTPLVGRTADVASVRALFARTEVRLVTLTGAPGIGKTRLAMQVASELSDAFVDGVVFLSLSPIRDSGLLIPAIARAVDARIASGTPPIECVKAALRHKTMLLVLDNFEQIVDAAPLVAELLAACHMLNVLVTSRAVLHLRGEHEFVVAPLALPDSARLPTVAALAQCAAVALFLQRARAIAPDFRLTPENARAVAAICIRLDGLPLAIELAVPRLKLFSLESLHARLEHRLAWLTDGPHDLPSRQRTVRNAIAWSDELLEPSARMLFRAFSVFVGGWTLDAAGAVCAAIAEATPASMPTPADGLTALINQSLVYAEHQAPHEPRFGMLETVREYAAEQLAVSGVRETARRAHACFYVMLAEEIEPRLYGADQAMWMERLEREHDNIRAALAWLLDQDETDMALRLSGSLKNFWLVHDHLSQGQRWFEAILARGVRSPSPVILRAKALSGAAALAFRQGDYDRAGAYYEETLSLCRETGDMRLIAQTLMNLGSVTWAQGSIDRAHMLFQESLALAREAEDRRTVARALNQLGEVARMRGNDKRGAEFYEESLTLWRAMGEQERVAMVLHNLGPVVHRQGDYRRAALLLAESLGLSWELRNTHGSAICLVAIAGVTGARGNPADAARLLGAAEALRASIGVQWEPVDRGEFDRSLATVQRHLDAAALAIAWAEGAAMPLEQAVATAQATLPSQSNEALLARSVRETAHPIRGGLTRREREVAAAVARGMTNRDIADALFIAEKTVEMHVSNSLSKLGFRSRTQLAAWAVARDAPPASSSGEDGQARLS